MATGIVKFFNRKSNFGFITPDGGETDVFVHGTNVIGTISDGDMVEYEIGEGRKGLEAKNVKKIGGEETGDVGEEAPRGKVVKMNAEEDEDLPMAA